MPPVFTFGPQPNLPAIERYIGTFANMPGVFGWSIIPSCTFPQCGPTRALVSLTDRADSPGATYRPLCPDLFGEHLGGTSAPAGCRELRSSRKTAPGAPVQGQTEIAAVRN